MASKAASGGSALPDTLTALTTSSNSVIFDVNSILLSNKNGDSVSSP